VEPLERDATALYCVAMWMLLALLISQTPSGPTLTGQRVPAPSSWVAFSAELQTTHPTRATTFGRYLQDEHGCNRREAVNPDGTLTVAIHNYEAGRSYTFARAMWTSQEMRLVPGLAHRPGNMRVERLVKQIEGFEAYLSTIPVKSPRGDYTQQRLVIPALNFFVAEETRSIDNATITAQNIRLGPADHSEFLPPAGVPAEERSGMRVAQFIQVVVSIAFPDRPAIELTTMEETPMDLRTPLGETVQIVTTVVDHTRNIARVRILKNAKKSGPVAKVTGDELGEIQVALGATVETTTLAENFTVSVRRINDRYAGK